MIREKNLSAAAEYVRFLIEEKGYSCIKYYNLVNEPNGYWSSTDGKYSPLGTCHPLLLWRIAKRTNLQVNFRLWGPDAAIWTADEAWWVDSCATHLKDEIGLYDIHTYPSKNNGEQRGSILTLSVPTKQAVPAGRKIVMGEIGFKFVEPADSVYQRENLRRAAAKPYASMDDSQMFVYDFMYGTDMADALFQTVNAGYSVRWCGCSMMPCMRKKHLIN